MFHLDSFKKSVASIALLWVSLTAHELWSQSPKEISFTSKLDHTTQKYLLSSPPGASAEQTIPLLILLHGHGSDRRQAFNDNVAEFRAARDVAAAHKMLVISPDYRAKTSWMGPAAEADMLQIFDDVKKQYRIGKAILAGASMGGSSALTFTALHPNLVDGVVAMNGTANHLEYENFQDAIKASFGGAKSELPAEYKTRSAEYWPERFTMPIAITAGGKDSTVPPASVLRLAEIVKKLRPDNVLLVYREDGGHSTTYDDSKAAFEFVIDKLIANAPRKNSSAAATGQAQ